MNIKSFSALITKQGYCVKAMLEGEPPIVFFTDNELNHRTWKATENNPNLLLDVREFHRLRDRIGLEEVSLSIGQERILLPLVKALAEDPYHGFSEVWRRRNKATGYDLRRMQGDAVVPRHIEHEGTTIGELPGLSDLKKKFV